MLRRAVHAAWLRQLRPARRRFDRACRDAEATQRGRLETLLADNARSAFGRAHGFAGAARSRDPVAAYRSAVPIASYEGLAPWIDRAAAGEPAALTAEPVRLFERTSGSGATCKWIPYTPSLLAEFSAATHPWLHDLHHAFPRLRGRPSYWSISPVAREREETPGGIPVGMEDDAEYFGRVERWAIRRLMAVPAEVAQLRDLPTWRFETARHLLACADLALVSVWSPSFWIHLLRSVEEHGEALLAALPARRARTLAPILAAEGPLDAERLWPELALVSCWTDAAAADFLPALRRSLPRVPVQGKGLLATEGVVSIPLSAAPAPVAAVASHFLEFLEDGDPARPARLAHELEPGGLYTPLLSTGGGLYRYHLEDLVRCVGFHHTAPLLRFEGRLDHASDLCGEKLDARQVDRALARAAAATGVDASFALVAPVWEDPPHYRLFLESPAGEAKLEAFARATEEALREAHHYDYCRRLGQLAPLHWQPVREGWRGYERGLVEAGVRLGDIKPAHFDPRRLWTGVFPGAGRAT